MERGSRGPLVDYVLAFLAGYDTVNMQKGHIVVDGHYGPIAVEAMKKFQRYRNLTDDGGCGPETRECLKSLGLDLEDLSLRCRGTIFVQPDGTQIEWPSGRVLPHKYSEEETARTSHERVVRRPLRRMPPRA